jgi:hypothetical protein
MSRPVQHFSDWLAATPASTGIQNAGWIIPTVQTIHILSIAIVMSSVLLIHLRVLGVVSNAQPIDSIARRFLPWIWLTLVILLLSGTTLIVGEPGRSLQNPAFIAKMSMLVVVILLTLLFQRGLRRDARFWERSRGRLLGGRLLAGVSLLLWIAIVFAGRWIAYIDVDAA